MNQQEHCTVQHDPLANIQKECDIGLEGREMISDLFDLSDLDIQDGYMKTNKILPSLWLWVCTTLKVGCMKIVRLLSNSQGVRRTKFEVPSPDSFEIYIWKLNGDFSPQSP